MMQDQNPWLTQIQKFKKKVTDFSRITYFGNLFSDKTYRNRKNNYFFIIIFLSLITTFFDYYIIILNYNFFI